VLHEMVGPGMSELWQLTATEAAAAIRSGATTSEALVSACLSRIADRDGEIGAFAHLDPAYAIDQARRADRWRGTGNGIGPLHGVPIALKDIIDTSDMPTECGTPIMAGRRVGRDAALVTQLRQAGAIILGKTVTTELALLTPAATRNPVNLDHTPGGSSAGSAAAVAAQMVPAALGSQTAGSVLRPASYCGVYGFKPTFGLVSRTGVLMQSHTLDTMGLLARSIADLALLTDCMAAADPSDPASAPRSQPRLLDIAASEPPLPPTLAFVKTPSWEQMADAGMKEAFGELVAALGDRVEEIEIASLAAVIEWQRIVQLAENAAYYGSFLDRSAELLSPGLRARLEEGARVPVRAYLEAIASREGAIGAVSQLFERYAAILTPAAPGPAPKGFGSTGSPIFNGLWTYLGLPTVSLPLLEVDRLPVGVQLVGPRYDDGRLLRTAGWLERRLQSV
jgi:Asp-tRNA(Asn)/Glu-tRNA(Gln) amidotransferase A subunit family amidase